MNFLTLIIFFISISSGAREVTFSWEPFEDVMGYQIEVSESPKFSGEAKLKKASKVPSLTTDLPMGTYYYRVRAVDKQKRPGHWSEPEKVIVTPYPPELSTPKNIAEFSYFELSPKVDFSWKPTEGNPVYEIFIYKTTGKKILEQKTDKTTFSTSNLKEGEYMWKVRSIYKNIYQSPYCEPRRFTIEKKPLSEPKLIEPIQNVLLPAYRPVKFVWQKDPSTHFSDLKVERIDTKSKSKNGYTQLNISESTEHTFTFEDDGVYEWSIVSKEGESSAGLSSLKEKFELRKDIPTEGNYSLEFGYSLLSSDYSFIDSRGLGTSGSVSGSALLSTLKGSYFFNMNYGLRMDLKKGTLSASGDVPLHEWTLTNSFRMGAAGFSQEFLFGYRQMNLYEFLSNRYNLFSSYGFHTGTVITGTILKNWRVRLIGTYYKPLGFTEDFGDLTADVYEGYLGLSWNPFYKFWINYHLGYSKHVIRFRPTGGTQDSKSNITGLEPFFITISLEN